MMTSRLGKWYSLGRTQLCVLGDVILDHYIWATADRVSPEAPALVLRADGEEKRPGGAASVAALAQALDCNVSLIGIVGQDREGHDLKQLVEEAGIDEASIFVDGDRPTTLKTRILGQAEQRQPYQLLRIDREMRTEISHALKQNVIDALSDRLEASSSLLVSDYGKGVCTPELLNAAMEMAQHRKIPIIVDPAKGVSFERYRGVSILTPNRIEAMAAAGVPISSFDDAEAVGIDLCRRFDIGTIVLKLDRDGLCVCRPRLPSHIVRSKPRTVCDVTGAGDMVLAVLGMCVGSGWSLEDAAELANVAAGLEVERIGVAPVSREEIAIELQKHRQEGTHHKIVSADLAADLARRYRDAGKRIVFTDGTFDLLQTEHIRCLEQSAAQGDILFVALNDDAGTEHRNGSTNAVVPQDERMSMIAALECVDHVIPMHADTPHQLLRSIRPDVLTKGSRYSVDQVAGREIVLQYGGQILITDTVPQPSVNALINRIVASDGRAITVT